MAIAESQRLLTAEEFGRRSDPGYPEELVRGKAIPGLWPTARHGQICGSVTLLLGDIEVRDFGRVINYSGVITERNPDTVRGADFAFYSYTRLPKGPLPDRYLDIAPELVIEVRSPGDRWADILDKVSEYLKAGVLVVCVLDPGPQSAHLYYPDQPPLSLSADDELTFPEVLGDFRVPVRRFFE